MIDLPALDAIKRGLVRTFDPESRKKAASERFTKRLQEVRSLEAKNLLERTRRREMIQSDSPSITGIIRSKARETATNTRIRRIENFNRDAFADNFSRQNLAKTRSRIQGGINKVQDFGVRIELARIQAGQSIRKMEREGGFDDMFEGMSIDVDSMISSSPSTKRSKSKKKSKRSRDPWDIPIEF